MLKKTKTIQDIWMVENSFYQLCHVSRISKLIYHYEIYKLIKNIPGDIFEFGVFKGSSLIRFLTFREILENSSSRKFYAFDNFGKFPKKNLLKVDKLFIKNFVSKAKNGLSEESLNKILKRKGFKNFKLIKGDVTKTAINFLNKNKYIKIALLHLDLDTYNATKKILKNFYNNVTKNGIILIDDYNVAEGVTKALDEFLEVKKNIYLKKLNYYKQPSFIIKK